MSKLETAIREIHEADNRENRQGQAVHPLSPLIVTFAFIWITVSFSKYDLSGVLSMVIYLLLQAAWLDISLWKCVRRIWPVFLVVSMVGIANPFVDKMPLFLVGDFVVTGGMVSMVTLMLKGIFCVAASYLLLMSTGIKGICYALRSLHVPKEIVTIIMLIYRYLLLLLKEVDRMSQAYKLRAPGQRGIHIRVWGSFAGQLLLRSMDRAEMVYESMLLRGYRGEFPGMRRERNTAVSMLYTAGWIVLLLFLRFVPVFQLIGGRIIS